MIQDLGNLADYIVNGDNYERVDPSTGNTLIIPTNYQPAGQPPAIVVPISTCANDNTCVPGGGPLNGYLTLDPSCTLDDTLYCVAHDKTTDLYFFAFNCAGQDATPDICFGNCSAYLASIDGQTVSGVFPGWLLHALGFTGNELLSIDYYFIACPGGLVILPNPPTPPPPTGSFCPTGDVSKNTAGGCPVGFFVDPASPTCCKPLDPPIPRSHVNMAGMSRSLFVIPDAIRSRSRIVRVDELGVPAPGPRTAPPEFLGPPLPPVAVMPLPPGNCGCGDSESNAAEMDL